MYLWQRLALPKWWKANEHSVRVSGGNDLVVIETPGRKRLTIEIPCSRRPAAVQLQGRFGGRVIALRSNWLKRFMRPQKTKPLRIGKRLVVRNAGGTGSPDETRIQPGAELVIPAGAAFGTGQHPTTAMSLRLLEQLTRKWNPGWSFADLGTGSGVLALAAKRFGAASVVAIDLDPMAISTAKENARLNRVNDVRLELGDVTKWKPRGRIDLVTANLFSELLIAVLPKIRRVPWLILSGVMRDQERELITALAKNGFKAETTRRRGKWIALLAARR
ncbi:MAG: 50S ribosomal protein L11 methyltransferase [Chthoniobacterales bacterium]